jgi:imidazole glycerol phosphate synthase glutamine amidotransferase subunit
MKLQVGIVNLAAGNTKSVSRAVEIFVPHHELIDSSDQLEGCTHVVIPGVSNFGSVINELHSKNLFEPLQSLFGSQTKILGLCAGMQIMGLSSDESPGKHGFNWFNFRVKSLIDTNSKKLFHTGWNSVQTRKSTSGVILMKGNFYFNHSYYVTKSESDFEEYGTSIFSEHEVVSIFKQSNILGVQFHPEKSQKSGLNLLSSFMKWK